MYTMDGVKLTEMIENATNNITSIFQGLGIILGLILLAYAAILFFKNLKNSQQAQWGIFFLALISGGFLATSGFMGLKSLSAGASETISDLTGADIQNTAPEGNTILVDNIIVDGIEIDL